MSSFLGMHSSGLALVSGPLLLLRGDEEGEREMGDDGRKGERGMEEMGGRRNREIGQTRGDRE